VTLPNKGLVILKGVFERSDAKLEYSSKLATGTIKSTIYVPAS
jgi:hypothetical protein